MSAGTLNPGVVDVFLRALDQSPGDRSGPSGRLTALKNTVVTQFNPGNGKPQRITVKQRNGFTTLPTTGHSSGTGATESVSWANPELLSSLGDQLLSIANAVPRVYDGTDWTHYADERVVSNVLSESVFHTSQHTIQATDSAWISGVTCSVWSEQLSPFTTTAKIFAGFRGDDGTWVRPPFELTTTDPGLFMCRVVADNAGTKFWIVNNEVSSTFDIRTFDLNGHQTASTTATTAWETAPGYWDLVALPVAGAMLARPLHSAADATDGVKFTKLTEAAGTITSVNTDNTDIHCRGPLAWITNDTADGLLYLATIGLGEGPTGRLWAYQINGTAPSPAAHEYNFAVEPPGGAYPDSLIGFVTLNDPEVPTVTVSFTVLSLPAQTVGPQFDPQLRYSKVYECTFDDTVTFIRQNDYTCQVSRAFAHDGEYYSLNYYQSGSGNTVSTNEIDVAFTPGDYMLGAPKQPLSFQSGDYTTGSTQNLFGQSVNAGANGTTGSQSILSGDKVEYVTSDGLPVSPVVIPYAPVGSRYLKWTFATNLGFSSFGGRLIISGSTGVTGANATWEILREETSSGGKIFFTKNLNTAGGGLVAGTFGLGGSATIVPTTFYYIPSLNTDVIEADAVDFFVGGSMVVTGNPASPDNGTKTILRVGVQLQYMIQDNFNGNPGVWIATGSEIDSSGIYTAAVSPLNTNLWSLSGVRTDTADIGSDLVVTNDQKPNNNGSFEITASDGSHGITVSASAILSEIFKPGAVPDIEVDLVAGVQTPYTFFLQDLTVDYSLINAVLVVGNDSVSPQNNGTYRIIGVDPDPSHHIVYCIPTDGHTGQRNQLFIADDQSVTIFTQQNVNPEYQPCWLIVPLTGSKPVVGRFEYGIAYADWKVEGFPVEFGGPDIYPLHVTSIVTTSDGIAWSLPYRAISFTVGQTLVTASGQVVNAAVSSAASTVGVKQFRLSNSPGQATQFPGSLLLPGPMCGEFTASGFHEQGVNFGFEAPFLVQQDTTANGIGLTKGATYQWVVVAEVTDEDGDRVFSVVSPPLNLQLSGDNNAVVMRGRMLQPLDSTGASIAKHFGVTNWSLLGISIYRTVIVDGVPTTERHKITLDLLVNGLGPISDTNESGFSFPDEFTWEYRDANLDASAIDGEVLYTDKGYLPRFPAPAQRQGVLWKDRAWVIGYDGAVWMSGEKKEGDATWFFPLFRFTQAAQDNPTALAIMDDYLLVLCEKTVWYIPAAQFPDSTGRNGTLPAMVETTFTNGCTGFAQTIHAGVAYSSSAGGVWLVTRGLVNQFISQPTQDDFSGKEITGMAVDEKQRLGVATGAETFLVYDQVVQLWSNWNLGAGAIASELVTSVDGAFAIQSSDRVLKYDTEAFSDTAGGDPIGVPPDITLSSLNFSNVRGLKSVWAMQLVGKYKGEHHLNAVLSYPDDDPANPTTFGPFTPDPTLPYLMEINPMVEQASSYGLRIFADFEDIVDPGDSFELELVSCEVGVESRMGLNKFPDNRRIQGT